MEPIQKLPLNRFRRRLHKLLRSKPRKLRSKPYKLSRKWYQRKKQSKHVCPMSDPVERHKLRRLRDGSQLSLCFGCKGKHLKGKRYYYRCFVCHLDFHRGCHALPPQMKHPLHPSHPLTLISLDPSFDTSKIPQEWRESSSSHSGLDDYDYEASEDCYNRGDYDDGANVFDFVLPREPAWNKTFDIAYMATILRGLKTSKGVSCSTSKLKLVTMSFERAPNESAYQRRLQDISRKFYDGDDDCDDDNYFDNEDDDDDGGSGDDDASPSDIYYGKCKCCQKRFEDVYYHCSDCNFSLNFTCTLKPPPLTISNSKSHHHTLTLFPRRIPLPCDVCGLALSDVHEPVYACLPCNYMVHRTCINLPRVIKITRHPHRLSLISSLFSGDFPCGVCRQTIDVSYGHYSCNKGCCYSAHSKCATRKDVWDGKDLEDVLEEQEETIEPFVRIDEEAIQHFTHDCYLKLQGKGSLRGQEKFCKACCLLISIYDDFYSCMDCNFFLHEACACLPRIKHHPLHKHPLILYKSNPCPHKLTSTHWFEGIFTCNGCYRNSSGFVYSCNLDYCDFQLDVICASLPDNSIHESHSNHPLYINLTKGECMGCKDTLCSGQYLECVNCKSFLGVKCATLPSVAHYKHDSHPLTLCYGKKDATSGHYWCEVCESKLDASEWFYTCDSCTVTLHVTCLLGIDMYMKPPHMIRRKGAMDIEIAPNDGNTRPLCYRCHGRCTDTSVFNEAHDFVNGTKMKLSQ